METLIINFNEYKLVHSFIYKKPLKSWINETNFNDIFRADWNELMPVIKKCAEILYRLEFDNKERIHIENEIFHLDFMMSELLNADINCVYKRVVDFIKWYNKQ
jgi:hypothetical protein